MEGNATQHPFTILNPNTSLAFLLPSVAAQLEATRYLSVASLAAFTWDLLCSLGQDYHLLTRYNISLPIVAYFISRVASLAHIVTTTLFHAAPGASCQALPIAIGCCWAVAIPSTSLLFFYRIRAVFHGQRPIVIFFGLLWLAVLGGSITVPFAITGGHIANTDRCIPTSVKPFSSIGIIASTCNDTLVVIAISWGIIKRTAVNGKVKSFFGGRGLPHISRELLRGGQQYYLITVGGNILIMAVILTPATPPLVRDMFPVINMALENSMACRVFRNIMLGGINPDHYPLGSDNTLPSSRSPHVLRPSGRTDVRLGHLPVMEITKTTETFTEGDADVGKDEAGPLPRIEDEHV